MALSQTTTGLRPSHDGVPSRRACGSRPGPALKQAPPPPPVAPLHLLGRALFAKDTGSGGFLAVFLGTAGLTPLPDTRRLKAVKTRAEGIGWTFRSLPSTRKE